MISPMRQRCNKVPFFLMVGETVVKTNEKVGDSREEEWGRKRGGRQRG